ncbi:uncharacterized protein PAC_15579 [Phialocephala subalpina]|uniref:Rhodopsin domain-containing protein n=1 Tax=Phialocephala subalpina TaxID=576137 RepID=A0A1L7XKW2_9HELO|nr:uncharacterized protein PAC_15579 [Phialocephala subalpina]
MLTLDALLAAVHGNGQKLASVSLADVPVAMQYWFAAELLYTFTTILIRLSIGFFLLRVVNSKIHIWTIRISMVIMTIITMIYFVLVLAQCHPVSYFWLRFSGGEGTCFDPQFFEGATIVFSVFAAATDIIFGILPIFVIWNLQMNRKAKMIVGGLLTLGILAGLSVIIRIYYVHQVEDATDFLFATSKVSIWSMIEPAVGICCMATSTYRPLFKSLLDKTLSTTRARTQATFNSPEEPIGRSDSTTVLRSKIGSVKSNHTKNSDSFDFEMNMESHHTTAEGPGKKRWGRKRKEEEYDGGDTADDKE